MRKRLSTIMAIVAVLGMLFIAGPVMAAGTAGQTVTMGVTAIDEITVSGPVTFEFNAGSIVAQGGGTYVVGSDAFQITDVTTTYSVTTNSASNKKITAHLDTALTATGLALHVALATVDGVTVGDEVNITSVVAGSPVDVVTGLLQEADADQVITYRAVATVETPIANYAPVVTFTLTDQG